MSAVSNLFRRAPRQPEAPTLAQAVPVEEEEEWDPHVEAVDAVLRDALAVSSRAARELEGARARFETAKDERARAERAAEDRGDERSYALLASREAALQLAARAHERASTAAAQAHAAVNVAETALTNARAAKEREARIEVLRERASLDAYRLRAFSLAEQVASLEAQMRDALEGIERAFVEANDARRELRDLGVTVGDVAPISPVHRIYALIARYADSNPNVLCVLAHHGDRIHDYFHKFGPNIADSLLAPFWLLRHRDGGNLTPERVAEYRAALEAVAETPVDPLPALQDHYFRIGDLEEVNRRRVYRLAPPDGCDFPEPLPPPPPPVISKYPGEGKWRFKGMYD